MIQFILKQTILIALINMALCVPQYDLVPVNCASSASNTIETQDKVVESIPTLILESFFGIDIPFPIHEDAHFLEKDFVVKRVIKELPILFTLQAILIDVVAPKTEANYQYTPNTIIRSKFFGYISRLHYF